MQFRDIFSLAYRSVSGNRLRAGLTISIIGFGIMALVGIFTAIDSMKGSIYSSFANMGANSFNIQSRALRIRMGGGDAAVKGNRKTRKTKTSNSNIPISYREAIDFKQRYTFPAVVSISFNATQSATVYKGEKKTNPNVRVMGGDENYLALSNYTLVEGRNLNLLDV